MRAFREISRFRLFAASMLLAFLTGPFAAATAQQTAVKSQEVSESDGLPVLIKHLPDWENERSAAVFINNTADLKKVFGERSLLDTIDFKGGTEAVAAPYPKGKLLIVEYATPQGSADADNLIHQKLAESPQNPTVFTAGSGTITLLFLILRTKRQPIRCSTR